MSDSTQTIVITGISRGIGRAVAERFAAGGWQVLGCASGQAGLDALRQTLPEAKTWAVNLRDKAQTQAFAQQILAEYGPPAALLNNAGIFRPGSLTQEADGDFEAQMALNLAAPYYMCKAFGAAMAQAGSGTIVNLGSTASITAYPNGASYCISKFALHGLTQVLREELKPAGVRVVSILPGATLTDSWAGTDLPPERFMAPQDVAETVWLACNLPPRTVIESIVLRPQLGDIG
jgi:NAD(P)-dependent dehydrogenase (short-subunit alcohol dehydrogenase family)